MLVTGLKNESLSKVVSRSDADCTDVHKALRECAEQMLYKYKQKQAQKNTVKLGIKIHATEILLRELSKVPEDPEATRKAISSALKRHAEELHNHEHLLSEKGNTYALLEQTRSLMERHGDAPASLLRYHDLKNKLLGAHTPLSTKEKEAMCILAKQKALTLQTLVSLDKQSRTTKETGMPPYVYDKRSFPLQGTLHSALLNSVECCTCKKVMDQPIEICSLRHLTCLECSRALKEQQVTRCPACPASRSILFKNFAQNIPIKRFIDNFQTGSFHSALLNSIECCICKNIMNQPREICSESHLTCLECSMALKKRQMNCPMCRGTLLKDFKRNIPIERIIGNLQARCCHADCRSVIEISGIESHLGLCSKEKMESQKHLELEAFANAKTKQLYEASPDLNYLLQQTDYRPRFNTGSAIMYKKRKEQEEPDRILCSCTSMPNAAMAIEEETDRFVSSLPFTPRADIHDDHIAIRYKSKRNEADRFLDGGDVKKYPTQHKKMTVDD